MTCTHRPLVHGCDNLGFPDSGGLPCVTDSPFIWPSFNSAYNSARLPRRPLEFPIKCQEKFWVHIFFKVCLKHLKRVSTKPFGANQWGYVKPSAVCWAANGGIEADSPPPDEAAPLRSAGNGKSPLTYSCPVLTPPPFIFPRCRINWLLMAAVIGIERAESD